jgi:subtilisin family serine protease
MPRQQYFYFLLFAVIIFFIKATGAIGVMNPYGMPPSFIGYAPRSIVVKFDQAALGRINRPLEPSGRTGIPAVDQLAEELGVTSINRQFPGAKRRFLQGRAIDLSGWHKIDFQADVDIDNVVTAFKKLGDVVDAQPIGIHAVHQVPNDTSYSVQWHLNQIDAPEAWGFDTGNAAITVAVLDTGVRWFHQDLGGGAAVYFDPPGFYRDISDIHGADGNMWINWAEVNGVSGVDDDGNQFTDDMIGWDFVDISPVDALFWCNGYEDCLAVDNDPRDFHGHGTHVAGIVGALNNNGYAVSSPAGGWGDGTLQSIGDGVKIMALRVGWADQTSPPYGPLGYINMYFAAQALWYAADNGARIVNASWGSSNSGGLGDAVDYFLGRGGIIFHAAGNSGSSTADYLGSRDDVVNIAATDQNDCKAVFSSFGDWVDVSAPGVAITSTWHGYTNPASDYVASLSGTSMASPLTAGVAALIWSRNPLWTAEQVKMKLLDSTDDIDNLSCNSPDYTGRLGSGRVNLYLAVGSCEGDLDGNGVVDGRDLVDLIDAIGCTSGCPFDLTYDGNVGSGDVDVFAKDFARTDCP